MGKFLKYEDSNFRTFKVEMTAVPGDDNDVTYTGKIIRPKKPITKDDLLGAIVSFHQTTMTNSGEGAAVEMNSDLIMMSTASISIGNNILGAICVAGVMYMVEGYMIFGLGYDESTDSFIAGMFSTDNNGTTRAVSVTDLENVFVDEFGRELVSLD